MKLALFALCIFFGMTSHAVVDMKNANYAGTWVDLEFKGTGYPLKVVRTYNSRSLFQGMFGFGWCSDFETKLVKTDSSNLKVVECGSGQEVGFVKKGNKFISVGKDIENVTFANGAYTREFGDGTGQKFDEKGNLTHYFDKSGNFMQMKYTEGLITQVIDSQRRTLNIKYYPNKKVKQIISPDDNLVLEYKFSSNMDDLSSVKNAWGSVYNYEYDDLHNLTKASYPDKTFISLNYDKNRDWVMSFQDRDKCLETYKYEFDSADKKRHYWSTVKKVCDKKVVNESKHEFWYKTGEAGVDYLSRVSSTVNGKTLDITYHDVHGKPSQIISDGQKSTFSYYPNGLVKVKESSNAKLTYKYGNDSTKVSEVVSEAKDNKGKVIAVKKSNFSYDKKGNPITASNSDGQKVEMTYDYKGRIATIKDHAKKLVKVEYDDLTGKPSVVTRPGVGAIKVTYGPDGEIAKVDSKDGPSVALQIAGTFNNLLDVIAPATAEIYQ